MSQQNRRYLWFTSMVTVLLAITFPDYGLEPVVMARDPIDPVVVIRPPLGSGSGSFQYLDNAIDVHEFTGSVGDVGVGCRSTCLNQVEKVAVWQGFPDGFEPLRLEVRWDAIGGISLSAGRTSEAHLLLEYDIGNGWETA
jgi:hypothetical protein